MIDILIMILCTIGAIFILIASIGIYKMPDFYARLSVTIKAATLGVGSILIGAALYFTEFSVTTKTIAIILFLFLTAPVAGYLIGKVAYVNGTKLWKHSIIDEMKNDPDSFCTAIKENEGEADQDTRAEDVKETR
nr:monovalent cation/H(+) antiporter subunit G [uncultured Flavobacterium sp.]